MSADGSSTDDMAVRTMRAMAWARAKGELCAVLETFWHEDEKFAHMSAAVEQFCKKVDDEGWAE